MRTLRQRQAAHADDGRIEAWTATSSRAAIAHLEEDGRAVLAARLPDDAEPVALVRDLAVRAAAGTFPLWLPGAEGITDATEASREAARRIAAFEARRSCLFGPFAEAMAVAALRDGPAARVHGFSDATTIRQCGQLLERAHPDAAGICLVLALPSSEPLGRDRELSLVWLAELGAFTMRIVGPGAGALERIPARHGPGGSAEAADPVPAYATPVSGRPSPLSVVENRLERYLAACDWSAGRRWNHTIAPGPLEPPLRVDLVWRDERVIVEIDGPEHAGAKYADDRRRDRVLQSLGYAVLRFTNEEVGEDVARAAAEIGNFLQKTRKGRTDGEEPRSA